MFFVEVLRACGGNPHKLQGELAVAAYVGYVRRMCKSRVLRACFFICFTILEYFAYAIFKDEKCILFFIN